MRNYFGTDGIRGIANEFLSGELAFRCGNALAQLRPRPLIVVGRDTRVSGDMLTLALAAGAMMFAPVIWGRQESYQFVPDCDVQVPPARSAMEAAEA